jgi:hypothetical protein
MLLTLYKTLQDLQVGWHGVTGGRWGGGGEERLLPELHQSMEEGSR